MDQNPVTWSEEEEALSSRITPRQYQTLLEVSEAIALHRELGALFQDLSRRLRGVIPFECISLVLHDPAREVMRLHLLESAGPNGCAPGIEMPVDEAPGGWVWKMQRPLLIPDITREARFPKVIRMMRDQMVRSFCIVPLTTSRRRLGAMGFGSFHEGAYDEADLEFLQQVARQVAIAVENALNYEAAQSYQEQLTRERDRLRLLLDVNNAVVSTLDLRELFTAISANLRRVFRADMVSLGLYEAEKNEMRLHALDFPGGKGLFQEGVVCGKEESPLTQALRSRRPVIHSAADFEKLSPEIGRVILGEGIQSACCVPLISHDRLLGTLNLASRSREAFSPDDVDLLGQVATQVAIAVENALAYRQIADFKNKLAGEKLYLEEEIRTEYNFEEIVGESAALKRVLKQVEIVAPTDSTVLIQGETGTGKELIARALHHLSGRRERTFVKLNCAAIPTGLLESELFGHEKGAFTGAIALKVGRFELAHGGTLFLDEVGDIPLELQTKLLRVLQEQEFERLGSNKTIRVDVRLIAATNRDLVRMVADKAFRNDLYYRLNVFPITAPALRDRAEDIPMLVRYFAQKYARRMDKRIETIPTETMAALARYAWPGNVRELENLIERAVILSQGPVLHAPLAEPAERSAPQKGPVETDGNGNGTATLEAAEREHILRVLRESRWVIGGPAGAAVRLGMKRTTLQSKMQRLGIARER